MDEIVKALVLQFGSKENYSMLLELARWLQDFAEPLRVCSTTSPCAPSSARLTALALSLWLGPTVIERLSRLKGGQPIRSDGPQSHFSKAGTPTMGGALILMTIIAWRPCCGPTCATAMSGSCWRCWSASG